MESYDEGIAKEWFVDPGEDLKYRKGWDVNSNPPTVLYHRTDKRNFASIMKNGLIPGGVEQNASGRPHVFFADKASTDENYVSGVRADRPLELQIDCRMAILPHSKRRGAHARQSAQLLQVLSVLGRNQW